ncbi:hypothetical protein OYT1_ch0056 [Ferriphaselus amnicola]|uniref:Uncharacterized protein n=1 Tax=Ferriphaselus amnicola TaxID=1188319 RepID=A0A2Z6G843_9PROT|nr:hypothetical protein OYT1_ch0056 [Ferriphaselus amnicola]
MFGVAWCVVADANMRSMPASSFFLMPILTIRRSHLMDRMPYRLP